MPSSPTPAEVSAALAATVAEERLRIVSTLIRRTGDWELAEDAVQDAVARALSVWPRDGIPNSPGAWLTTVARNAAVDALRRAATERRSVAKAAIETIVDLEEERTRMLGASEQDAAPPALDDDRLRLIFTCCHPVLPIEARVALTLRTVVGMRVDEIARAFLASELTMQKRLVRARAKIRSDGIPFRIPPAEELPERMDAVLSVLYLLFTEGYSGGTELVRRSLAEEAIRLTRLVAALLEGSAQVPEVLGLLGLMLFQHSRAAARLDAAGDLVLLEDQDRSQWDAGMIGAGLAALAAAEAARTQTGASTGPYRLQAEIARQHATAASFDTTDFVRIAGHYEQLVRIAPSPVIELQRAIAVSFADGPVAGLAALDAIDDRRLDEYHLQHAARADMLLRSGRAEDAARHFARALELAPSQPERRFHARRIEDARSAVG
jgi:RNA polymerase sigma-70 factor (ECF subfamily)